MTTGENTNDLKTPERPETQMDAYPRITEIHEGGNDIGTTSNSIPHANQGRSQPGERNFITTRPQPSTLGVACAILSHVPPVMSVLQKIKTEKRTRMEHEEGTGEEQPRPMKTRRQAYMETQEIERDEAHGAGAPMDARNETGTARGTTDDVIELGGQGGKSQPGGTRRTSLINLMKDQEPNKIEKALKTIQLEITFLQVRDVSPRLRQELALLLRSSKPRSRKKK